MVILLQASTIRRRKTGNGRESGVETLGPLEDQILGIMGKITSHG
jgi:hypothetical protein